jgi:enoyl-[acyl-carrier-protein] reductase (NADH)
MTYLNDKTRQFTEQLAVALGVDGELYLPLDIQKPEQVAAMCATIQRKWGKLDVVLHAMAFAPMEALHAPVLDCPLDAFQTTMAVSVHSLIALSQKAVPLMTDGGSIFTLTYFGGDKVVPHYGIMGPAKSCLEGVVRYLAAELGPKRIRVNAISPGPLLTRAACDISHFDELMEMAKKRTVVSTMAILLALDIAADHQRALGRFAAPSDPHRRADSRQSQHRPVPGGAASRGGRVPDPVRRRLPDPDVCDAAVRRPPLPPADRSRRGRTVATGVAPKRAYSNRSASIGLRRAARRAGK